MGMIYFALFILIGIAVLGTWVIASVVDRVNDLIHAVKRLNNDVEDLQTDIAEQTGRIDAHEDLIAGKASTADIERASNAYLNVRNKLGQLGNRLQVIERDIKKGN